MQFCNNGRDLTNILVNIRVWILRASFITDCNDITVEYLQCINDFFAKGTKMEFFRKFRNNRLYSRLCHKKSSSTIIIIVLLLIS